MTNIVGEWDAKGLVAELALSHILCAWWFKEERVRAARLAACCNYFYKKKKCWRVGQILEYRHG